MSPHASSIAFDISTDPVGLRYTLAGDNLRERLRLAPRMLAASVLYVESGIYADFLPKEAPAFIDTLKAANRLISFNGKKFDLLVLRKHHGLKGRVPSVGHHIDIGAIAQELAGRWVNFGELVKVNLAERKLTMDELRAAHGLQHDPEHRTDAFAMCRSDIRQTVALWKLWQEGKLRVS